MHYLQTEGIVILRYTALGEQDISLKIFTKNFGMLNVTAKGAKKINSSRLGSLQTGNIISASLTENKNTFFLTQSQTIFSFLSVQKNVTQTNLLFYLCEILSKLIPYEEPLPTTYYHACAAINCIDTQKVGLFIYHEVEIIKSLGYGVPSDLNQFLLAKDWKQSQLYLRHHVESIIDKPLESKKLFS